MDDQNQDHKTGGLPRWFPRNSNVMSTSFLLPLAAVVAVLALAVASLISFVALRSEMADGIDVTGEWQIGLVVHRGPDQERVGLSLSCRGIFVQTGTTMEGEFDCGALGRAVDVTGFVSFSPDAVTMSVPFTGSTLEVLADVVSSVQLIGSWEDSQGFAGRFVAVRP